MAKNGLKWMDSDMHLCEPTDLWDAYIDPKYQDYLPRWTGRVPEEHPLREQRSWIVGDAPAAVGGDDDTLAPDEIIKRQRFPVYAPYMSPDGTHVDAAGQLRAMETEGVDVAILFPTFGIRGWQEESLAPDITLAITRAYNDWLYDFTRRDPARLKVNALVPIKDVDLAVAEIRRVAKERAAVSISPSTSRPDVRFDDPALEPIWAEAEALDLTITFHGRRQVHLQQRYKGSVLLSHSSGRGIEHPVAFMELLFGGVLERHPNLRFAFLEAGGSWVTYWLFRLEEEWERFRGVDPELAGNVTMRPVDYWRRQCWTAVEPDEWTLGSVIQAIGDENLVISSDFPHFDSAFPHVFERFLALEGVSRESKRKILWDNCARLYNLS